MAFPRREWSGGLALLLIFLVGCGSGSSGGKKKPLGLATNPTPADAVTSVLLDVTLDWDAAEGAESYDVYLDTVSPPTALLGNVTWTNFVLPASLEGGTQYFWRVDSRRGKRKAEGTLWTFTTHARGEDRTLVIENVQSPISQAIAAYYLTKRPVAQLLTIDAPASETVNRTTYDTQIHDPIWNYLTVNGLEDEIWYIVTTKGVPLRISGNSNQICVTDERASVDAELVHLGRTVGLAGKVLNPYYGASEHFSKPAYNIYLVCRLTGYETDTDMDGIPDDVKDLIDRGSSPIPGTGQFVLDVDPGRDGNPGYKVGNDWMRTADTNLQAAGFTTLLDETNVFLTGETDVLGYASWGSNDANSGPPPLVTHSYIPGAIVTTYVSTNGRSFQTGTSYGQSLVADLIREGVTGANANVYEPCLDACAQPQYMLVRYTEGYNLGEAIYTGVRYYSWMNVVVGDPLCCPY